MSPRGTAALLGALALAALMALSACSGNGDSENVTPVSTAPAATLGQIQPQPDPVQPLADEPAEPNDGTIEVHVSDGKFVQNKLVFSAGQPVKIRVLNDDNQPHNLRIAGFDGKYQTEDDAVTTPETIDGGSSGELTFAPPVAGAYTFRCDFFPGSMGGQIIVR